GEAMIGLPAGTRAWLAAGVTDMGKGMDGVAGLVQTTLAEKPLLGRILVFRGRRGGLGELGWWSGGGRCLFAKRLERGPVARPVGGGGALWCRRLRGGRWHCPQRS